MRGKRFISPGPSLSRERPAGVATGSRVTPSRQGSAAIPQLGTPKASSSAARRRRDKGPGTSYLRNPSPEVSWRSGNGGSHALLSSSTRRSISSGNVHNMLSDLVQLSQNIATYLDQEPGMPTLAQDSVGVSRERAALNAQEIERIVTRVQAHFKTKLETLERENSFLRQQLAGTRADTSALPLSERLHESSPPGEVSSSVRRGIAAQENALDELGRTWAAADGSNSPDVDQLRGILLAEKRQRLLVEEQTQSLTEQHAKVVSTLERRLKKQEEQLRDLINAVDTSYSGNAATRSPAPSSPTSAGSASPFGGGQVTPRRLLRQQLAQHQQTQRALQQYREHLAPERGSNKTHVDASPAEEGQQPVLDSGDGPDYLETLGLGDVRATLQAIQRSTPPVVIATSPPQLDTQGPAAKPANSPGSRAKAQHQAPPQGSNSIDDIGSYLDSIAKELETLGAEDDFL